MFIKRVLSGLGLAVLFSLPIAYAGDCSTSFDQSCLSGAYNQEEVERGYHQSQERLDQVRKEVEEHNRTIDERIRRREEARREQEQIEIERIRRREEARREQEQIEREQEQIEIKRARLGEEYKQRQILEEIRNRIRY